MAQMLSNLPIGAKVKFGKYSVNGEPAEPITWLIAAKDHKGDVDWGIPDYPTNSVTLLTEKMIDYRFIDNAEPDRNGNTNGWSDYGTSNIDQWLNTDGEAGKWFVKQHDKDHAPDGEHAKVLGSFTVDYGTAYANRPGFLNAFTQDEKDAILTTSIYYRMGNSEPGQIDRKVFLPSCFECAANIWDGYQYFIWELFRQDTEAVITSVTSQAYENSPSIVKSSEDMRQYFYYWTRDAHSVTATQYSKGWSAYGYSEPANGRYGIRPALNISSATYVSDTTDSDGAYTIIFNVAPPAPNTLSVPDPIYGGRNNTISWSSVIDPDGDSVTYELDCVYDDGTVFATVYSGTSLSYSHAVEYGKTSVQYRVRAVDSKGGVSEYTTAPSRTVTNNQPPIIGDPVLTTSDTSVRLAYSVRDAEGDTMTIDEYVDNEKIRTFTATGYQQPRAIVDGDAWTKLSNGTHTIKIVATDSNGGKSEISTNFTKLVENIDITTKAMESPERPNRITLTIARVIPEGANFMVLVCNNARDTAPTWEDATESILKGDPYMFANEVKTSDKWAVMVEIVVERNGVEGACYISSIGGAFD